MQRRAWFPLLALLYVAPAWGAEPAGHAPIKVTIRVDAGKPVGELRPIWRYFGADEPNYAYMKDGKKLLTALGELGAEPGDGAAAAAAQRAPVYFRTHNLLTTGDGTPALKWGSTNAYTEDANGNPVYDWTIVDRIIDTYLERGVKPYVQVGFMPKAMSTKPEPYQHSWTPKAKYDEIYTGWAYPPKDYAKWGELVFQWTKHCVEKYGKAECESWWWQPWNEPNIGYWRGTPQEFHKLYDYTVDAIKRALPTARVGGPETAGGPGRNFMRDFYEHCLRGTNHVTGKVGTPIDFLSFHAKGSPKFVEGHVRMGVSSQLRNIDDAFKLIARYPELKDKPIVIGESDPDGCAACQGPQLGYRNGTMYSSYTAASFARKHQLADRHGVNLEGALTWAFEFEDQPYFAGFRALATNGIDLPVLNVFRMFAKMSGKRLAVTSSHEVPLDAMVKDGVRTAPDVAAMASGAGDGSGKLFVFAWHYHDDDVPGPDAAVELTLAGLPPTASTMKVTQYLIDAAHSNAFTAWQKLGSPQSPTPEQYAQLEAAAKLATAAQPPVLKIADGAATATLTLPRQAVTLLVIEPTQATSRAAAGEHPRDTGLPTRAPGAAQRRHLEPARERGGTGFQTRAHGAALQ